MASATARFKHFIVLTFACSLLVTGHAESQAGRVAYPQIRKLDNEDPLFSQLTDDIALSRQAFAAGGMLPPLSFYRYRARGDQDLYAISARTNLGIETIATANGFSGPDAVSEDMELILPNIPGIFAAVDATSDLERMTLALRYSRLEEGHPVVVGSAEARDFVFFPDEKFQAVERAFFLGILFRFPLREGYISSGFGMRIHPVTGFQCLHSGIDIAAPQGYEVLAARGGRVAGKGYDRNGLGNYVLLAHEGGYSTLYGHLASIVVTLNQDVNSGSLIGTVGSTGLSTGPHLHFEVRNEGGLRDPVPLIYGNQE